MMSMPPLPPEIATALDPGEEILWQAQPRPAVYISRCLPNLAYGITWSVLGAVWYYGSGGVGQPSSHFQGWWSIVPLLSLPFILAGFSFWMAPLRLGPQARRTWYLVTNQRILIAEVNEDRALLRIFTPEECGPPTLVRRWNRLDDLILTRRAQTNPHLLPGLDAGFFGLSDGPAAVAAIQRMGRG